MNRAAGILLIAFAATAAYANEQIIRKTLTAKLPKAKILSVKKLPYAGLYEVALQQGEQVRIFYTDGEARALLVGANLIETATERSLTEERLRELTRIDWGELPFKWAITSRRGDGHREIAIFSDPNCPFCRKFERDLARVDDITVHIFMFPVVKPESIQQTASVWCSKDRVKAWNDLMLRDIQPTASPNCDNPIGELIALGKKLKATSTPTWFTRTGEKYQGAIPMSQVVPLLDAAVQKSASQP